MKKAILIIVLFATANIAFAQKANKQTIVIKTQIYCSHCLQCGSCGANINDHITATKGIKKVVVDPKENTITVSYDANKTTPEKIREAINKAGYDADDQKATAEAVNTLDGCCKKH
jgi:periplasmic mercuric ion binding protein